MKKYLSIIFLMFTYFLFAQNLAIEYKGPNFNYNLELKKIRWQNYKQLKNHIFQFCILI